jgi:hypothetical protein
VSGWPAFAGAQKKTLVLPASTRWWCSDLLECMPCPSASAFNYKLVADNDSMYNRRQPNTIYIALPFSGSKQREGEATGIGAPLKNATWPESPGCWP